MSDVKELEGALAHAIKALEEISRNTRMLADGVLRHAGIVRRGHSWEECISRAGLSKHVEEKAYRAGLEAAARVCDDLETTWWSQYKDRQSRYAAEAHREGMSDGAANCATAIRALMEDKGG